MDRQKPILLVEDDENDVILIQQAFLEAGICEPLAVVHDAGEAIRYLTAEPPYDERARFPFPEMVLLDLQMRPKPGGELLKWLQSHPELRRRMVVVILSGSETAQQIRDAYALGANSYLVKPFDFRELVVLAKRVREYWLDLNRLP